MFLTHIAISAGDHNRLVITAHFTPIGADCLLLKAAEIAAEIRATKFIVKRCSTNGPLYHNIQGRDDSVGLAIGRLPGLAEAGDI